MEFEFTNKKLEKLYLIGTERTYKLPKQIVTKFMMRIQQIEAAETVYDFWNTASLHFKKLKGAGNTYSIRIDKTYRLEFEVDWKNEEKTIGKIFICELSKHYGD